MSEGRSVWRLLFNNIRKALKFRPTKGVFVGEDSDGNKYYEAEGKVNASKFPVRWFVPKKEGDWQQDLPAEWEAWLRSRRKDPPTDEEVLKNLAMAKMKKAKGDEIRIKAKNERLDSENASEGKFKGFPSFEEYEKDPGKHSEER